MLQRLKAAKGAHDRKRQPWAHRLSKMTAIRLWRGTQALPETAAERTLRTIYAFAFDDTLTIDERAGYMAREVELYAQDREYWRRVDSGDV